MYSHFSQFICPSGVNMTSPYGYAVQAPVGQGEGSCFYAQNVSWTSQSSRIGGPSWPVQSAYYPLFTDTGAAIVLYEQWSGNGGSMGCDDDMGQPYSTHYRYGYKGAQGIGRNILYADWHCTFLPTGPPDDVPFMLWGQYPYLRRGNDMGNVFQDQWQGRTWTAWDLFQEPQDGGVTPSCLPASRSVTNAAKPSLRTSLAAASTSVGESGMAAQPGALDHGQVVHVVADGGDLPLADPQTLRHVRHRRVLARAVEKASRTVSP